MILSVIGYVGLVMGLLYLIAGTRTRDGFVFNVGIGFVIASVVFMVLGGKEFSHQYAGVDAISKSIYTVLAQAKNTKGEDIMVLEKMGDPENVVIVRAGAPAGTQHVIFETGDIDHRIIRPIPIIPPDSYTARGWK